MTGVGPDTDWQILVKKVNSGPATLVISDIRSHRGLSIQWLRASKFRMSGFTPTPDRKLITGRYG